MVCSSGPRERKWKSMAERISAATAAEQLAAQLDPGSVATSGADYEESCRIWNGAVTSRPAVIVRARTAGDVQTAVRVGRACGLALSVRGGGHDWAGRSLREGGLVIDLRRMARVGVRADERVAFVGGGATAADLTAAAAPHSLAAVTGTVGAVGMAGLTLGGGYGPLTGRFGLAADNLLGMDVVLADGRLITADADHEPELFWALRGGGGNFGVVTSLRLRLHAVERVLAGMIAYPLDQAPKVLERLDEVLGTAPDELTVQVILITGPDGVPALFLAPTWSCDLAAGESHIERLQRLGTPVLAQVGPLTYRELLHTNDAQGERTGKHVTARTRSLPGFTQGAAAALADAAATLTSPYSGISIHHFHGAATRVPIESTAFGIRRSHLMAEIIGWWQPGDKTPHEAWADKVSQSLAREALPGGYPNMLGPADHAQIADAYGPNTARLLAAKRRYDPDSVFAATPMPPTQPATN